MTITIPAWILWTLGAIAGIAIVGFAAVGIAFLVAYSRGSWR